jgi:hypothetical protein
MTSPTTTVDQIYTDTLDHLLYVDPNAPTLLDAHDTLASIVLRLTNCVHEVVNHVAGIEHVVATTQSQLANLTCDVVRLEQLLTETDADDDWAEAEAWFEEQLLMLTPQPKRN